jgi:hypothetical protein
MSVSDEGYGIPEAFSDTLIVKEIENRMFNKLNFLWGK